MCGNWNSSNDLEREGVSGHSIARDLHDTLLQSFRACSSLPVVLKALPERPAGSQAKIGERSRSGGCPITEGRDAVQGLRSSVSETNDLANAKLAMGRTALYASNGHSPSIEKVEGGPRR